MAWPLAEAKNRFSELFEKALREGPQRVSRRGKDEVVVVAAETFERLRRPRRGFVDFLVEGAPLEGVELDRDRSPAREVEL
jgi:prevent-host-death family protein